MQKTARASSPAPPKMIKEMDDPAVETIFTRELFGPEKRSPFPYPAPPI